MPNLVSPVVRPASFYMAAGAMPAATTIAACVADISALAVITSMICAALVAAGPVLPPLIDQWQRVRIVRKVLDKMDSVDDAAKLLQALAPATWQSADPGSSGGDRG
jgi:hypothetical protein